MRRSWSMEPNIFVLMRRSMTSWQLRPRRKAHTLRTVFITKMYLKLSNNVPLKDGVNIILIVEESRNEQVNKQVEPTPAITEDDQDGDDTFEQSQDFTPDGPVNLRVTKQNTASAGGK